MSTFLRENEHLDAPVSGSRSTTSENINHAKKHLDQTGSELAYGCRLLVHTIDAIAAKDPQRPYLYIPISANPQDGWKAFTYGELANAINHVAHEVSKLTKDSTESFPTVAYIGASGAAYMVMMIACVKAGCKALFISPRNNIQAQMSLFERTNCDFLLYGDTYHSMVQPWLKERRMTAIMAPKLEEWSSASTTEFPYTKTLEQARWEPLAVLHTSGSTGTPKPIVLNQGSFFAMDSCHNLPDFQGSKMWIQAWAEQARRLFVPMPSFHAAGAYMFIASVVYDMPLVMPVDQPLTMDMALESLVHSKADAALFPPAIVEQIAASEEGLRIAKKLEFLAFAGGNLSPTAAEILSDRGVKTCNLISSTEYFPYLEYWNSEDTSLSKYFLFNSELMGIEWRPAEYGNFEMVIKRKDPADIGYQCCFYTFPDLQEWSTKDLYKPHPTIPNRWAFQGRIDDVIVFSNGEKLNPVTLEAIVTGHADVKGALVVGQDRFQAALILEPAVPLEDEAAKVAFIDKVWPTIERANKETVAHGRIARRFVTVSDADVPFVRAGKGTIQRATTVRLYQNFINSIFENADVEVEEPISIDTASEDALTASILDVFKTKFDIETLDSSMNFFSAGADSLQVISLVRLLRASLKAAGGGFPLERVNTQAIYKHPTAEQLAAYLYSCLNGNSSHDEQNDEVKTMERLLAKYTADLPEPKVNKPDPLDEGQTVILSGTTGSLGAYMLDYMCKMDSVKKILAFNRGEDGGQSRQPTSSQSRGLGTDFSKVEFLGVDLSQPDFGLGAVKYGELLGNVDRIIHNAWPVNFNISTATFEPHIRGVRNLANFSNAAEKKVPVIFISSIGSADGWTSSGAVPEGRIDNLAIPQLGYGRSKMLGDLILGEAAARSGVPAASIRVGQIGGSRGEQGVWNRQEWFPTLVASSVYLGLLPEQLGPFNVVDWSPIEDIAGLVLDVAGISTPISTSDIPGYFHGVNPAKTAWSELAPAVKNFHGDRIKKLVPLEEWVAALEASETKTEDLDRNPGIKLLDTYRGMLGLGHVVFGMERTKDRSPTMRELGPITPALMENWCRQWAF